MSLLLNIPKGDLAKGIPISNGWAKFEITQAYAKPSKNQTDPSVNYIAVHKLIDDPNEREISHNFNSKALGMMAPWIAALAGKTVQEILDSITSGTLTFDFESTIGKKVNAKVEQQIFEGRIISKLVDFASPDKVPF